MIRSRIFQAPYPYMHGGKNLFKIFILMLIVGFLFEYLIIPFERTPDEHKYAYWIICLFHVGAACIIYLIYGFITSLNVCDEDWSLGKEAVFMFFLFFLIGLGEWMIRDLIYYHPNNWQFGLMLEEVWHAYLAGGVIMFLVLTLGLNLFSWKNLTQARRLKLDLKSYNDTELIQIKAGVAGDDFELDVSKLICVKAAGNYLEFYLEMDSGYECLVKRLSLQKTMEQLQMCSEIVKTHRAFAVNILKVDSVKGNAAGYTLKLHNLDFKVPVSRKQLQGFNEALT